MPRWDSVLGPAKWKGPAHPLTAAASALRLLLRPGRLLRRERRGGGPGPPALCGRAAAAQAGHVLRGMGLPAPRSAPGWAVGPQVRPTRAVCPLGCRVRRCTDRRPRQATPGQWRRATAGGFKLICSLSNPEARVFATFWLDHPTAEGGAGGPEAEETAADAEGAEPVPAGGAEQEAGAVAPPGAVHPLQPRRHEQQPQLRGEEKVPDHLQPDPHQCGEEERYGPPALQQSVWPHCG